MYMLDVGIPHHGPSWFVCLFPSLEFAILHTIKPPVPVSAVSLTVLRVRCQLLTRCGLLLFNASFTLPTPTRYLVASRRQCELENTLNVIGFQIFRWRQSVAIGG